MKLYIDKYIVIHTGIHWCNETTKPTSPRALTMEIPYGVTEELEIHNNRHWCWL